MGSTPTYDELHGSNNWDGLLDPLHPSLRNLLFNYGDLITATRTAFNNDDSLKYCGYSNYGKSSLFKGAGVPRADSKYNVTSFIYATAKINSMLSFFVHGMSREGSEYESNWIGYIAVSNDEYSKSIGRREICVVWRGTDRNYEWMDDILSAVPESADVMFSSTKLTSRSSIEPGSRPLVIFRPKVMEGWLTIYTTSDKKSPFVKSSAKEQIKTHVTALVHKYKDEKVTITCTGHSLGASLALLSAYHIAAGMVTSDISVSAIVVGCPQVGDQDFKQFLEELYNVKVLRVNNEPDFVPSWPSKILTQGGIIVPNAFKKYVDVGVELLIDSRKSPYLKHGCETNLLTSLRGYHNFDCYYHTLCGWNGKNGDFDSSLLKKGFGFVNMHVW